MLIVAGALLLIGVVILIAWNIEIQRNNPVRKALKKAQAEAKLERRNRRASGSSYGNDGTYWPGGGHHSRSDDGGGSWWDGGGDSGGGDSGGGGGGGD
jgi:hypothetical protein